MDNVKYVGMCAIASPAGTNVEADHKAVNLTFGYFFVAAKAGQLRNTNAAQEKKAMTKFEDIFCMEKRSIDLSQALRRSGGVNGWGQFQGGRTWEPQNDQEATEPRALDLTVSMMGQKIRITHQ